MRTGLLRETCLSTSALRPLTTALVAAGAFAAALPASAANFDVANDAQLRSAIASAQNGDTITFTSNVTLASNLPALQNSVIINGSSFTLSGNNQYRGLSIQSGAHVFINSLTIANASAQGGNGGDGTPGGGGGGGGAGLGGALFIASGATVLTNNVTLSDNLAQGGSGGGIIGNWRGGGGGGGGGGRLGSGGSAHGIGYADGGQGGAGGGGKGADYNSRPAGAGEFGGGGGGAAAGWPTQPENGGFGGGGGGSANPRYDSAQGGFGGGNGNIKGDTGGNGGGGAGLGGAIFVQEGGSLIFQGSLAVANNRVAGGTSTGTARKGEGIGSGLFLHGSGSLTFAPGSGQTQTIADDIVDLTGITGSGGSWSLVKNDTGTTVLTGKNAYSGGITVNGGVLQGNSSSLRGNIRLTWQSQNPAPGSVVFEPRSADPFYSGNITGSGSLIKIGAEKLVLSGVNTYTGGTTVQAGTLQGSTASLQGNIQNNSALIFSQDFDGTYGGNITSGGPRTTLTKRGGGKVNLTGTVDAGLTTLWEGGLAVNGRLSGNVLLNGGVMSGVGNITGDITQNGGEIAPGNSIGNLTINGNLTVNRGTFEFEISPSSSDRITIVGAGHRASLTAGTLQVVAQPGTYVPNTRYTIVSAPAGGIASFGDLTGGVGFLTPTLSYDTSNLYLTLVLLPDAFRSAGQTANQQAIGGALDSIAAGGDVGGLVTAMANVPTVQGAQALQALSPEPYADFGTLNVRAAQLFMNAVGQQLASGRGLVATGGTSVALAQPCEVACDADAPSSRPLRAWIAGIGGAGSIPGDGNASGLTYNFGGTAVGIDYRLDPRFLVGIAAGYSHGTQWAGGFQGNGTADTFSAALYGSYTEGRLYVDALAGYAHADNRLTRPVAIPGFAPQVASGRTSADQVLGQLEAGYSFGLYAPAKATLTPFARLQVASASQAGFTESGVSPFNLAVSPQNTTSARSTLGVDLAGAIEVGARSPLALKLRLGWTHEYADTARPITAAFASASTNAFTVLGVPPPRDSALVGLTASLAVSQSTSLYLGYDGELGGGADNHALSAGLTIVW
ncbi:MAG: autotransporter domain-containing protein [Proteobacteria bacterium]|nr:autotransporter domain-containing protein [Pseudomonadota bacterium]